MFHKNLIDANVDTVGDWFDSNGNMKTYAEMVAKGIKPMQYNQIITALPKDWKTIMKQGFQYGNGIEVSPIGALNKTVVKAILVTAKSTDLPAGIKVWQEILQNMDKTIWTKEFLTTRKLTKEVKLQIFHYKTIHRILACKEYLHKSKITASNKCDWCPQVQTLQHLLFECPQVQGLWNAALAEYKTKEQVVINNTLQNCIFYTFSKLPYKWRLIALHLREHIYMCNLHSLKPSYSLFKIKFSYKITLWLRSEKNQKSRDNFIINLWKNWSSVVKELYEKSSAVS